LGLVLGKVIEVVTKQDYFDHVREHLYKPAGMMNTDAYELDRVNPNLAVGYQKEFQEDGTKRFRNNLFLHVIRGGPAGGGYSTAEDLVRFAEALKSGKLVSPNTFELIDDAEARAEFPSVWVRLWGGCPDGRGRPQRWISRHQLQPGHLQRHRLPRGRAVQLRWGEPAGRGEDSNPRAESNDPSGALIRKRTPAIRWLDSLAKPRGPVRTLG